MLLIQSDMFKALWFMIYPIVIFVHGPIPAQSVFCQVNGFFLTVGLSASDMAVLMIAIHSALYIFKPRASSGEGGLYPYRHYAYFIWFFFPITVSSLAFINGRNAYIALGTFCYLPVRPFWYRLAISWIPRYVIFLIIVAIYASIYYYVRNKFHGFDRDGRATISRGPSKRSVRRELKRNSTPPTPKLDCHGLILDSSRQDSVATDPEARKPSTSRTNSTNGVPLAKVGTHRFIWANILSNHGSSSEGQESELSTMDSDSFTGLLPPEPLPAYLGARSTPSSHDVESVDPSQSRATSWRDDFVSRLTFNTSESPSSRRSIFGVLQRGPPAMSTHAPTPASQLQLVNSRGQNLAVSEVLRTREKIRLQLRFLFIYPLVYMGMWVVPFVSHTLQYDDKLARNPPFGLTCATTIFISAQAAVDAWLFSTREKPWKHIPGTDGSFWGSLRFWSGWNGVRRRRRKFNGPGKTREEMVREARAAYQRREEELAQRRSEILQASPSRGPDQKREKSWWEASGLDGVMATATDERSNPMDEMALAHVGTGEVTEGSERVDKPQTSTRGATEKEESGT
jgi:G protein-coupled receptor GPR1